MHKPITSPAHGAGAPNAKFRIDPELDSKLAASSDRATRALNSVMGTAALFDKQLTSLRSKETSMTKSLFAQCEEAGLDFLHFALPCRAEGFPHTLDPIEVRGSQMRANMIEAVRNALPGDSSHLAGVFTCKPQNGSSLKFALAFDIDRMETAGCFSSFIGECRELAGLGKEIVVMKEKLRRECFTAARSIKESGDSEFFFDFSAWLAASSENGALKGAVDLVLAQWVPQGLKADLIADFERMVPSPIPVPAGWEDAKTRRMSAIFDSIKPESREYPELARLAAFRKHVQDYALSVVEKSSSHLLRSIAKDIARMLVRDGAGKRLTEMEIKDLAGGIVENEGGQFGKEAEMGGRKLFIVDPKGDAYARLVRMVHAAALKRIDAAKAAAPSVARKVPAAHPAPFQQPKTKEVRPQKKLLTAREFFEPLLDSRIPKSSRSRVLDKLSQTASCAQIPHVDEKNAHMVLSKAIEKCHKDDVRTHLLALQAKV